MDGGWPSPLPPCNGNAPPTHPLTPMQWVGVPPRRPPLWVWVWVAGWVGGCPPAPPVGVGVWVAGWVHGLYFMKNKKLYSVLLVIRKNKQLCSLL